MGLGLCLRFSGGGGVSELNLVLMHDSLALRSGSDAGSPDNVATLISEAEKYYGSGNVTIEKAAQGGLALREDWANANGATTVYAWEQDTDEPSTKITGLISSGVADSDAVNAVVLFTGTNDADAQIALGWGTTYTKAQYKDSLKKYCAWIKETAFPKTRFIGIVPFHRNDQGAFAEDVYQGVLEAIYEVVAEVSYVKLMPSILDVDLADAVHPTGEEQDNPAEAAYQAFINPRLAEAIATYHGKTSGSTTGMSWSAEMRTDHMLVTITHDKGDNISVPLNATNAFRADDDGSAMTVATVEKVSSSSFKVDLSNQGIDIGSTYKLYHSYGQTEALQRIWPEVIRDKTEFKLALQQGVETVTEGDLIRQLPNLAVDMNARAGAKTLSGSDVTAITESVGNNFTSSAGRYPQYDPDAFGGAGALFAPDTGTHMVSDTNFTKNTQGAMFAVFEVPPDSADFDIVVLGTSSTGNSKARLRYDSTNDRLQWAESESSIQELKAGNVRGNKFAMIMDFNTDTNCDVYINSSEIAVSFDHHDFQLNNCNRMWLFSQTTSNLTATNAKITRASWSTEPLGESDPTVAELMYYMMEQYNIPQPIDDIDFVTRFEAGTSVVTEAAGKVTAITDLSGNGNDLALSSGATNEMTYDVAGINGRPTFISADSDHKTHFRVGSNITVRDVIVVCRYRDGVDDIFPASGTNRDPSILAGAEGFNGYPRITGSTGTKRFLAPDSEGNPLYIRKGRGPQLDATLAGAGGDPMPMSLNVYRFTFTEAKTAQFYFFGGNSGKTDAWRGELPAIVTKADLFTDEEFNKIVNFYEDKYRIKENRMNTLIVGQSLATQLVTSNGGAARDAFHTELFAQGYTSGLLVDGGKASGAVRYEADTGAGAFLSSTNDGEGALFSEIIVANMANAGIAFEDVDAVFYLQGNQDENAIAAGTITAAQHKDGFETFIELMRARCVNAKYHVPLPNVGNAADSTAGAELAWTQLKKAQWDIMNRNQDGDLYESFAFYDLARADDEHLTNASYEDLGERMARLIGHHTGKSTPNNPLGPAITSATYDATADEVDFTITYDDGTDIVNTGEVDDFWIKINGTYTQATTLTKNSATSFTLSGGLTIAPGDTVTLSHAGGSSASQTIANVYVDNATNPLPIRPVYDLPVTDATP